MNPDVAMFRGLIDRHLERGVERPVPEYTELVINRDNYAYFSHLGRIDAMNYSAAVFLINDDVRALYVIYNPDPTGPDQKERRYLVKTLDPSIKVDDYVVIPSTVGHKLTVAKVTGVDAEVDFDSTTVIPWIVQRINLDQFNTTIQLEEEAVTKIKAADFAKRRRNLADTMMSAKDMLALPLAKKRDE